jgi:hypothetical protein
MWKGVLDGEFPPIFISLPLTTLNPRDYADQHFLFHFLLIPFTWSGNLTKGAKTAVVVFSTLAILSCYWLLLRARGTWRGGQSCSTDMPSSPRDAGQPLRTRPRRRRFCHTSWRCQRRLTRDTRNGGRCSRPHSRTETAPHAAQQQLSELALDELRRVRLVPCRAQERFQMRADHLVSRRRSRATNRNPSSR